MFWTDLLDIGLERDPWFASSLRSIRRLQGEMNQLFEDVSGGTPDFPAINLWTNPEDVVITAALPGVDPAKIDLSVQGNVLTIGGDKSREPDFEGQKTIRAERGFGRFSRSVQLPFPVDQGRVDAQCRNGMLRVVLPRAESDKPKKISVK